MRSPRLGDRVYWVEQDRPTGKAAAVRVRSGVCTNRDGNRMAVYLADGATTEFLRESDLWFADAADADTFALGVACRLLANFKYETCEVTTARGQTATVLACEAFALLRAEA